MYNETKKELLTRILSDSNYFFYGPGGELLKTIDVTKVINDYLIRKRTVITDNLFNEVHADLFNHLSGSAAVSTDLHIIQGVKRLHHAARINENENFNSLKSNVEDDYYINKQARSLKLITWTFYLIAAAVLFFIAATIYNGLNPTP